MIYWFFLLAALLLTIERVTYYWVSHNSDRWLALCASPSLARLGEPSEIVQLLFYGFKILQMIVFLGWCMYFSGSWLPLPTGGPLSLGLGFSFITVGTLLNFSVFYRLGTTGVFYGKQFGKDIPWVHGFPFSLLKHPQYIGTLLSIWGFFIVMRYPHGDWIILPLLETLYYSLGAKLEP